MNVYKKFFRLKDSRIRKRPLAVFCNHTSFDFSAGEYFIRALAKEAQLKKVFVPEHGFFAELQDQVPVEKTDQYNILSPGTRFVSLYNGKAGKDKKPPGY